MSQLDLKVDPGLSTSACCLDHLPCTSSKIVGHHELERAGASQQIGEAGLSFARLLRLLPSAQTAVGSRASAAPRHVKFGASCTWARNVENGKPGKRPG